MSVKLTIGTAVYNVGESFLRANIESTVRQLTDETEFLLIDDCSTDNSGEICKEYATEDGRVRYVKMEKNGGLSRVRNRTIAEAAGEWIMFADGDDLLSDNFVETALKFLDPEREIILFEREKFAGEKGAESPCEAGGLITIPEDAGRELSLSCLCLKPHVPEKFGMSPRVFHHAAWGALYKKDFLLKYDLKFPEGQKKAQDSVFNTDVYFYAKEIAYLPYVMYYYRVNQQGITQRYSADFPEMARSLIGHHRNCLDKLYPGDAEAEELYKSHRMISLALDSMRLNYFHRDNPNSRADRKKAFLEFADSEPYKSAIDAFDPKKSGRYEWDLAVRLAGKKRFAALDYLYKHDKVFRVLQGANGRIKRKLG